MQKDIDSGALKQGVLRGFFFTAIIAGTTFALDFVTKALFFAKPDLMSGFSFFSGVVKFTDFKNFGISFNIPLPLPVTILITLGVILGVVLWLKKERVRIGIVSFGAGLLIGGALANLFDRIALGYVRDWLLLWNRSAINLADVCVLLGILLLWRFHKQNPSPSDS